MIVQTKEGASVRLAAGLILERSTEGTEDQDDDLTQRWESDERRRSKVDDTVRRSEGESKNMVGI